MLVEVPMLYRCCAVIENSHGCARDYVEAVYMLMFLLSLLSLLLLLMLSCVFS